MLSAPAWSAVSRIVAEARKSFASPRRIHRLQRVLADMTPARARIASSCPVSIEVKGPLQGPETPQSTSRPVEGAATLRQFRWRTFPDRLKCARVGHRRHDLGYRSPHVLGVKINWQLDRIDHDRRRTRAGAYVRELSDSTATVRRMAGPTAASRHDTPRSLTPGPGRRESARGILLSSLGLSYRRVPSDADLKSAAGCQSKRQRMVARRTAGVEVSQVPL
jgi:hypothetical protein